VIYTERERRRVWMPNRNPASRNHPLHHESEIVFPVPNEVGHADSTYPDHTLRNNMTLHSCDGRSTATYTKQNVDIIYGESASPPFLQIKV
jgi:hypothetical protein